MKKITLMLVALFATFAISAQCDYTLEMNDSFGDGWNGALMDVLMDGVVVLDDVALDDAPNNDGAIGVLTFPVTDGADVTTLFGDGGTFPGEISYRILDSSGLEVGAGTADPTTDIPTGTITANCPACSAPGSPMVANIVVGTSVDISWGMVANATGYNWEIQNQGLPQGDPTAIATGSTANITEMVMGAFLENTAYTLFVQTDCDADGLSTFVSADFLVPFAPPVNDDPTGAVALMVGSVFEDAPAIGSNMGATDSSVVDASIPLPGCANYGGGDVWFSVIVPVTGNITIETNRLDGSALTDSGLSVYDGDLGTLALVECDDDDSDDGLFSLIDLTDRTPGETLLIRVHEFGNNVVGEFQVSAFAELPAMCEYTLEMNDGFGDGWNGALMDVLVDGVVVLDDVALDDDPNNDGFQGILTFPVIDGSDVTTMFGDGGTFPGEVSYRIIDLNGIEVGAGTADPTTDIPSGTITGACPTCITPMDLAVTNFVDGVSTDISWSMVEGAVGYNWEVQDMGVPQGDPAAIASGNTTATMETAMGVFVDGSSYTLFVQTDCDAGDVSEFASLDFDFIVPPANDDCENAIALNCDETVTGSTIAASDSGSNAAPDVFFTYTGTGGNENITLSLCDGGTDFDSLLRVFDDECMLVNEIAVNDDSCGLQSELTFLSDGVTTYTIMVEGFGAGSGNFSLAVTCEMLEDCLTVEDLDTANITETSADLSWTDINATPAASYDVEWGETGFAIGAGTVEAGVANPFTLGGLVANTTYDFYVTANCTADDISEVSMVGTFTTIPEQAPPGECEYTLQMFDSFGDGWNGGLLSVFRNGQVVLFEVSLGDDPGNDGATGSLTFEVLPGDDITTVLVNPGTFPAEISYDIIDVNDAIAGSGDATVDIPTGTITADCEVLSVEDNTIDGFTFFPNPAVDVINISAQTTMQRVSVVNLAGQVVIDLDVNATNSQLDVSRLSGGVYIMNVTANDQVGSYKIIKQ